MRRRCETRGTGLTSDQYEKMVESGKIHLRGRNGLDHMWGITQYDCDSHLGGGFVVYARFGKQIFYSGITSDLMTMNTMNAVENIIEAIAEEESIPMGKLEEFELYDLQTGYGWHGHLPGWYLLQHVTFQVSRNGELMGLRWQDVECPEEIFFLFKKFHGAERPYTLKQIKRLSMASSGIDIIEAARLGSIEAVKSLERMGESLNTQEPGDDGYSVLDAAISGFKEHGDNAVLEYLIASGTKSRFDIDPKDRQYPTKTL